MEGEIHKAALHLVQHARRKQVKIVAAESCTGGMVCASLVDIAGASDVFDGGFVTYCNDAKIQMLNVSESLLADYGAVSQQVAQAMAQGALEVSQASLSVAITGIAGPDGGSEEKPVGLVHFAIGYVGADMYHESMIFKGDRLHIRQSATLRALELMLQCIK